MIAEQTLVVDGGLTLRETPTCRRLTGPSLCTVAMNDMSEQPKLKRA